MTFGRKLQLRRTELGLRQQDVAKAVGVDAGTYSRWESGENKPRNDVSVINILADILSVPVEYFNDEEPTTDYNPTIDILKIIDDAMVKKDRSVTILISPNGTSISVYPYSEEKPHWISVTDPGGRTMFYRCSECGKSAHIPDSYCRHCGEALYFDPSIKEESKDDQT